MTHAVLYRWKLKPGKEDEFSAAWARMAEVLCAECGALGSRLHTAADGTHVAYSLWPSREAWQLAQIHAPKSAARALMAAAIEERFPETHLEAVAEQRGDGMAAGVTNAG